MKLNEPVTKCQTFRPETRDISAAMQQIAKGSIFQTVFSHEAILGHGATGSLHGCR